MKKDDKIKCVRHLAALMGMGLVRFINPEGGTHTPTNAMKEAVEEAADLMETRQ